MRRHMGDSQLGMGGHCWSLTSPAGWGWVPYVGDALAQARDGALWVLRQLPFKARSDLGLFYLVPQDSWGRTDGGAEGREYPTVRTQSFWSV